MVEFSVPDVSFSKLGTMEDIHRDFLLCHVLSAHTNSYFSSNGLLQELLSVSDSDSLFFTHLCYLTKLFQTYVIFIFNHCLILYAHWAFIMNFIFVCALGS